MSVRLTGECAMCHEPYQKLYKKQYCLMAVIELCSQRCFQDLQELRRAAEQHVKLSKHFARPSIDLTTKKEEKKR